MRWDLRPPRRIQARGSSRVRRQSRLTRRACASGSSPRRRGARGPCRARRQRASWHGGADFSGTLPPVSTYVAMTTPLGQAPRRRDPLSRRRKRHRPRRQLSSHRGGGPPAVVGRDDDVWEGDPRGFAAQLRAEIRDPVFPQLGAVEFEHAWAGTLGNVRHVCRRSARFPPAFGSRALWAATGSTPPRWRARCGARDRRQR